MDDPRPALFGQGFDLFISKTGSNASEINVINSTAYTVDEEGLKAEILLMLECLSRFYKKPFSVVNVCLMMPTAIKKLNKEFLGKDRATDTLSFTDEENPVSGDLAICLDVIREDAIRDGKEFELYFAEVVLHGLLHLFGLEHDYSKSDLERVYKLHDEFLKQISLNRVFFNVQFN